MLIYCFILFFCYSSLGLAQVQITSFEERELPTSVRTGLQCSRGFVWMIPDQSSLYRYDGYQLKEYPLPASIINKDEINRHIFEDAKQMIWMSRQGLGKPFKSVLIFDPFRGTFKTLKHFLQERGFNEIPNSIIDLIPQYNKTIIIVTNQAIYEYNGQELKTLPQALFEGLYKSVDPTICKLSDAIYCNVSEANSIQFWSNKGQLIDEQFLGENEVYEFYHAWTDSNIVLIRGDSIGAFSSKLWLLSPNKGKQLIHQKQNTPSKSFGAFEQQIFLFERDSLTIYDEHISQKGKFYVPNVKHIVFFDYQGGVWYNDKYGILNRVVLTTKQHAFYYYDYGKVGYIFGENETKEYPSRGIAEGKYQDFYISQSYVLLHVDSLGNKRAISGNQERNFADILGISLSRDQTKLWVADNKGLWMVNTDELEDCTYYLKEEVKPRESMLVWQPYEDQQGQLWLGTSEGLYLVNQTDSTASLYQPDSAYTLLNTSSIFYFFEDDSGLWLCTSNGLFLKERSGIKLLFFPILEERASIAHLYKDIDGTFWLATKGNGLLHWSQTGGVLASFNVKTGLSDNVLYAVYKDDNQRLWLPSNNGLICFDKETEEAIVYQTEDGIPNLEFNTVAHFQSKTGHLFFGGVSGTISFDPKDLYEASTDFEILLSDYQKWNMEDEPVPTDLSVLNQHQEINFHPNDKRLELSFCLSGLHTSKTNQYAYKIVGFDKKWQQLLTPTIKLNSLPYGKYELLLRAKTSKSYWTEHAIRLNVIRPFYTQWWFVFLLITTSLALIYGLLRWRVYQLEKVQKQLEDLVAERTLKITEQAEALKQLDKVKSRFFANISHELRTPLTLILGPVSKLKNDIKAMFVQREVEKVLQIVDQQGKQLLNLIEEMLELSKLDAQKLELNLQKIHLYTFVDRVFQAFESLAYHHQIRYHLRYQIPKTFVVELDEPKVARILNNLLSNAFKFTPANGIIELIVEQAEQTIIFSVKDTGYGIEQKDLQHIFDRFFQSSAQELKEQGGTGIGLSICQEFAHFMHGEIKVKSQVGEGSQFFFYLPIKFVSEPPKSLTSTSYETEVIFNPTVDDLDLNTAQWTPEKKQTNTILLIEDNLSIQTFIREILAPFYKVILANNGAEGLQVLNQSYPAVDLIISDLMMPVMDGFTVLTQIKEHQEWRSIPFIMLTARAAEQDKLKALHVGVNDYLIKPFSIPELLARVKNLLDNKNQRELWHQELLLLSKQIKIPKNSEHTEEVDPEPKEEVPVSVVTKQELEWLKEVEVIIVQHIDKEGFDVASLAQALFLSKRQLERKIKHITGCSPAKLIKELRLQKARTYLENNAFQTVLAVSLAVGFQTPSYFTSLYKKRFGKSPQSYF